MSRAAQGGGENAVTGGKSWNKMVVATFLGTTSIQPWSRASKRRLLDDARPETRNVMLARFAAKEGAPDSIRDGLVDRGFNVHTTAMG